MRGDHGRPPTALVFALLVVAVVSMLGFDMAITRVIGVLAIFGFIVTGVFAIANREFLAAHSDDPPSSSRTH